MIHRGELWRADLGEPRGSAPALRRPFLVMQAESYNRSRLPTVVVIALTTGHRLAAIHGNVFVPAPTTGLPSDSVVDVTQLATLDRDDLDTRIGALPAWMVAAVERGLRRVLGM